MNPDLVFEIGLNHMGDKSRAVRMIDTLHANGAKYITIQCLTDPERVLRDASQIEALTPKCLSLEDYIEVAKYAAKLGLVVGSTVTGIEEIPSLAACGISFFKILSSDIDYFPLHEVVAATHKPFYLSTGACELHEIDAALKNIAKIFPKSIPRLIHTVIKVPTPAGLINLSTIPYLKDHFGLPVAYGQHSDIHEAIPLAFALGADCAFVYVSEEKVPELPDGPHSVRCCEIGALIASVALAKKLTGSRVKILSEDEEKVKKLIRRTVVAAKNLDSGTCISMNDLFFKRPLTGEPMAQLQKIIGSTTLQAVQKNEDLTFNKNIKS